MEPDRCLHICLRCTSVHNNTRDNYNLYPILKLYDKNCRVRYVTEKVKGTALGFTERNRINCVITLWVTDDGVGLFGIDEVWFEISTAFSDSDQKTIFSAFSTADASVTALAKVL